MVKNVMLLACFLLFTLMVVSVSANPRPDPAAKAEADPEPRSPVVVVPCVGPRCYGAVIKPLPPVRPCYGRRCGY
ncbi:hypothetical protein Trydic_g6477 [Trypoxylus dichotomus]